MKPLFYVIAFNIIWWFCPEIKVLNYQLIKRYFFECEYQLI
jgi:hypothetical protein